MNYATGHNSFTSQYLFNIYIYCRLCIINCEIKKGYLRILQKYEYVLVFTINKRVQPKS
jgi:hypothetical protein